MIERRRSGLFLPQFGYFPSLRTVNARCWPPLMKQLTVFFFSLHFLLTLKQPFWKQTEGEVPLLNSVSESYKLAHSVTNKHFYIFFLSVSSSQGCDPFRTTKIPEKTKNACFSVWLDGTL